MTTAEISAYLYGVDHGKTAYPVTLSPRLADVVDPTDLPADAAAALFKLGLPTFTHWFMRGAVDGLNER